MKNEENTMNIFNKTDNYINPTFTFAKLKNLHASRIWYRFLAVFFIINVKIINFAIDYVTTVSRKIKTS